MYETPHSNIVIHIDKYHILIIYNTKYRLDFCHSLQSEHKATKCYNLNDFLCQLIQYFWDCCKARLTVLQYTQIQSSLFPQSKGNLNMTKSEVGKGQQRQP